MARSAPVSWSGSNGRAAMALLVIGPALGFGGEVVDRRRGVLLGLEVDQVGPAARQGRRQRLIDLVRACDGCGGEAEAARERGPIVIRNAGELGRNGPERVGAQPDIAERGVVE